MRVNIYCVLLACVLGWNVTAGLTHQVVQEKQQVKIRCPYKLTGDVLWSRESEGRKVDILTVVGDRNIKHINDPGRRYDSLADRSLFIIRAALSDSGRYLCNNDPAVELTVIPSGTEKLSVTKRSNITLKCPPDVGGSDDPTWSRDSGEIQQDGRISVSHTDKTLTIRKAQPADSGLYYCDGKPAVYLNVTKGERSDRGVSTATQTPNTTMTTTTTQKPNTTMTTTTTQKPTTTMTTTTTQKPSTTMTTTTTQKPTTTMTTTTTQKPTTTTSTTTITSATTTGNILVKHPGFLAAIGATVLFIIILIIIYFIWRCRSKRRRKGEQFHVYDEIQDGAELTVINGLELGSAYCMTELPGGSNQDGPTYTTIPDLPQTGNKIESPYSLIGGNIEGNFNGSSQLTDNTYFLLEKPKASRNLPDQHSFS